MYQFYVENGHLHTKMHMRSADLFLGVPYNILTGSIYAQVIGALTGYPAAELIIDMGNVHIYNNHFDAVHTQLSRQPVETACKLEIPNISDVEELDSLLPCDFTWNAPDMQPGIQADVAV